MGWMEWSAPRLSPGLEGEPSGGDTSESGITVHVDSSVAFLGQGPGRHRPAKLQEAELHLKVQAKMHQMVQEKGNRRFKPTGDHLACTRS